MSALKYFPCTRSDYWTIALTSTNVGSTSSTDGTEALADTGTSLLLID